MNIGIHEIEKTSAQEYVVSIALELSLPLVIDDKISNYFDYDKIYALLENAYHKKYETQEFFAHKILTECKKFKEIQGIELEVKKTTIYKNCDSVGLVFMWVRNISEDLWPKK